MSFLLLWTVPLTQVSMPTAFIAMDIPCYTFVLFVFVDAHSKFTL